MGRKRAYAPLDLYMNRRFRIDSDILPETAKAAP